MTEPLLDETFPTTKPIDGRSLHDQPSLGARALRRFSRFLLIMTIGAAATLAWQSYGGVAKQMVLDWVAQSGWSLWLPLAGLPSALDVASRQATRSTPAQGPSMEPSRPEAALGAPPCHRSKRWHKTSPRYGKTSNGSRLARSSWPMIGSNDRVLCRRSTKTRSLLRGTPTPVRSASRRSRRLARGNRQFSQRHQSGRREHWSRCAILVPARRSGSGRAEW